MVCGHTTISRPCWCVDTEVPCAAVSLLSRTRTPHTPGCCSLLQAHKDRGHTQAQSCIRGNTQTSTCVPVSECVSQCVCVHVCFAHECVCVCKPVCFCLCVCQCDMQSSVVKKWGLSAYPDTQFSHNGESTARTVLPTMVCLTCLALSLSISRSRSLPPSLRLAVRAHMC